MKMRILILGFVIISLFCEYFRSNVLHQMSSFHRKSAPTVNTTLTPAEVELIAASYKSKAGFGLYQYTFENMNEAKNVIDTMCISSTVVTPDFELGLSKKGRVLYVSEKSPRSIPDLYTYLAWLEIACISCGGLFGIFSLNKKVV